MVYQCISGGQPKDRATWLLNIFPSRTLALDLMSGVYASTRGSSWFLNLHRVITGLGNVPNYLVCIANDFEVLEDKEKKKKKLKHKFLSFCLMATSLHHEPTMFYQEMGP